MSSRPSEATPPGEPWRPLQDDGRGYLSVYLSDPLARWPVRDVTRKADNKSDPNIETLTYGLFSTCEPKMRRRIVEDGASTLFFLTTHRPPGRALTGYYHLGWYTEGARGAKNNDYALAADIIRFVEPIPVSDLSGPMGDACRAKFRTYKPIGPELVGALRALVDGKEEITVRYLDELSRMEAFSRGRTGYAYPSWGRKNGFSWDDAPIFYYQAASDQPSVPNSSSSGRWRCLGCDHVIESRPLLKQCPVCSAMTTLRPEA